MSVGEPVSRAERAYWLARSQGFTVESPEGRVGEVAWVVFESRPDRPDLLAVRRGLLRRLRYVSVEDVDKILPRERRLVVKAPRR